MLTATNLACIRGDRRLFAGLGFTLESGGHLYVTGENGSGKTSLLRMLCGLSPPETGEIRWQGETITRLGDDYRKKILYLGHQNALKEELTALENLRIAAALTGATLEDAEGTELLERSGLAGRESLPVRFLSQGQKRRVALTRLLWSRASLWVLDEPFVALDSAAVTWLAGIIAMHHAAGGMTVLTSHQAVAIKGGAAQNLRLSE
ncbi:MAG: cytochrome c biogenesis heme-transporting ATPase CcmA [Betaproteobacteria bacterium]|nr:cytochrome c biogenesis heme-transporting ATPase CcmA [Betaproteobacteria bacterium]